MHIRFNALFSRSRKRSNRTYRLLRRSVAAVGSVALISVLVLATQSSATNYQTQVTLPFAGLSNPSGVVSDQNGNIFVSDWRGGQILERLANGNQITVAQFDSPSGLALDGAGDLFFAQGAGQVIELQPDGTRTILPFTDLNFFAPGLPTFPSLDIVPVPGGVAVDGTGDVFVTDVGHDRVEELTPNGFQATVPIAGLSRPTGVAVDPEGDIFVADTNNNRVLELTPRGSQTVLAFTGLNSPSSVAVDRSGDVVVSDSGNNRVVQLTPAGTQTTLPMTGFSGLQDVTLDAVGNAFATDAGKNNRLVELPIVIGSGTMTASPSSGISGTQITASSLTPCPGGASGRIFLRGYQSGRSFTSNARLLDSAGDWFGTINVPGDSPAGLYTVTAECVVGELVNQDYNSIPFTVTTASTTTALKTNAATSTYAQPVTFSAFVSGPSGSGTPNGTVTFKDGSTNLGTALLVNSGASLTTSSLSAGIHSITATYSGDRAFTGSTSNPLTETVNKASTALIAATASKMTQQFSATLARTGPAFARLSGQTVVFSTASPTGGQDMICSAITGSDGTATCTGTIPAVDKVIDNSYTATYAGNSNYLGSTATAGLTS